ncbi:MAG: clan AA aspartic protease, partial [Acidobacteria bacterium]|nr:clan AA aspartic protease [Acidobacteriota bacterium]
MANGLRRWGMLAAAVLASPPLFAAAPVPGVETEATAEPTDSVARLEAVLAEDDSRPDRWRAVVLALMYRDAAGDRVRAAETARRGLERLPGSAEIIALNARSLLHLGDLGGAAAEAGRAMAVDATAAEAYRVLGEVHLLEWRLDDARDALERAAGLAPFDPDPFRLLAGLYERTKQYPLAADHWEVIESRIRRGDDPAPEGERVATGRTALLRAMGARTPFAVDGRSVSTTVPMRRSRSGQWLVKARVNGGPEEWFDVDTGSEAVLISVPLMRKLNVAVISTSSVTGIGGRAATGRTVILDSLRIGEFTVRNVPAEVLDRLPGQGRTSAGSLGQAFLREFVVTMDFPRGTFSLALPRRVRDAEPEAADERQRKIKYTVPMRYPTVTEGYWEDSERIP